MLEQGRYTCRHNCTLNLEMCVRNLISNSNIVCEFPGRSLGLTAPSEVLVTSARPGLDIHYPDANILTIIELNVGLPFETNIAKERTFKINKHVTLILIQDIKEIKCRQNQHV